MENEAIGMVYATACFPNPFFLVLTTVTSSVEYIHALLLLLVTHTAHFS